MTVNASSGTSISVSGNGSILLENVTLGAAAMVAGGSLEIRASTLGSVTCSSGGTVTIESSNMRAMNATNCTSTLRADRFATDVVSPLLQVNGGKVIVENNTFISTEPFTDPVHILAVSGSRFDFNTLANFSGVDGTATAVFCDTGLEVSSNIFAWHSSADAPLTGCTAHDSLFDALVPASQVGSNHQVDASAIFVDLNGKDLHLSTSSPARALGQPGIVGVDLEGNPRPNPVGSRPDIGALEAP
jgi:hypothetical protein